MHRSAKQQRQGVRFKDGKLMLFPNPDEVLIVHCWPELKAVRKKSQSDPWTEFLPAFRLLKPRGGHNGEPDFGPANLPINALDPAYEKLRAFVSFRQSVPKLVAQATERFSNHQFSLLKLCNRRERIVDLLQQNPALTYCLAQHDEFRHSMGEHYDRAAEISRLKQKDILKWLQFPDTNATAKILSKVLPEVIDTKKALGLRAATSRDQKQFSHLSSINAGVLSIVSHPNLLERASPNLLGEISEHEDERVRPRIAPLLNDICRLEPILRREPTPRKFQSIAKVRQHHREITDEYLQFQREMEERMKFPPPPLPGTADIVPLMNADELIKEGREQHNCVGSYGDWVRAKKGYIYRVIKPERATLSIERGSDSNWTIEQLFASCNQPVEEQTVRKVMEWLDEFGVGV